MKHHPSMATVAMPTYGGENNTQPWNEPPSVLSMLMKSFVTGKSSDWTDLRTKNTPVLRVPGINVDVNLTHTCVLHSIIGGWQVAPDWPRLNRSNSTHAKNPTNQNHSQLILPLSFIPKTDSIRRLTSCILLVLSPNSIVKATPVLWLEFGPSLFLDVHVGLLTFVLTTNLSRALTGSTHMHRSRQPLLKSQSERRVLLLISPCNNAHMGSKYDMNPQLCHMLRDQSSNCCLSLPSTKPRYIYYIHVHHTYTRPTSTKETLP